MSVRVVVAEDEAIIRLDLVETLNDAGYTVVADTGRGDEAVALAREHRPDVVIVDIKMPGLDGIDAARAISTDPGAAIVVLTAFSQRDLIDGAIEAGALAYLVKPFQRSDLVPAIEVAVARHRERQALAAQAEDLEDQLATRKLVDRAKGRLIDDHGLSESDAFAFVQRTAMGARRRMADVAADIIDGSIVP